MTKIYAIAMLISNVKKIQFFVSGSVKKHSLFTQKFTKWYVIVSKKVQFPCLKIWL